MANVFIQIDKPFYIAGDTVNGCVFLNLYENVNANEILIKFKGWESVKWFEERIISEQERASISPHLIYQNKFRLRMESSDSEDHPGEDDSAKFKYVMDGIFLKQIIRYTGQRQIARFDQVLYNFGGNFIPAGQYSFPFSFKTGENYPASFVDKSAQNNRRGRIKYQMQAFARGFNDRLILLRTKQEIIIREMTPIKNDQQQMEAHVKSCCCIDQGITRIQCFFQKNGYIPGEDARIFCKLDNTLGKSEVISVDVTLLNQITYTSSQGFKKTFTSSIFKRSFSGLGPGQQGERENVVKVISTVAGTGPSEIKPTSRGNRLHSVYFLVVEANLAAACTCCSDLPVVRQPILIYPYIPIDYNFKAPPNWNPKIMPAINLQVGLSTLGIKPQVNMNMGMPSVNANLNMNMGAPNVNMNVNTSNVNISPPKMNVNINGPSTNMYINGPNVNMNVGMPSVNMHMNGPSVYMNGPSMHMNGPNMNIHAQSSSINTSSHMGLSVNVPSPHVEMSVKSPPTTMHMHGNLGGGVHVGMNENFGNRVGVSANINSPNKQGGIGVGLNLRPF